MTWRGTQSPLTCRLIGSLDIVYRAAIKSQMVLRNYFFDLLVDNIRGLLALSGKGASNVEPAPNLVVFRICYLNHDNISGIAIGLRTVSCASRGVATMIRIANGGGPRRYSQISRGRTPALAAWVVSDGGPRCEHSQKQLPEVIHKAFPPCFRASLASCRLLHATS